MMNDPTAATLAIRCGECAREIFIEINPILHESMSDAEAFDAYRVRLNELGWATRKLGERRMCECPNCQERKKRPDSALEGYVGMLACPKCGEAVLGKLHCHGLTHCNDKREHLHRNCPACGYHTKTRCADTAEKVAKRGGVAVVW